MKHYYVPVLSAFALIMCSQSEAETGDSSRSSSNNNNNNNQSEHVRFFDADGNSLTMPEEHLEGLARYLVDEKIRENLAKNAEKLLATDPEEALEVSTENQEYLRLTKEVVRSMRDNMEEGQEKTRLTDYLKRIERVVAMQNRIVERSNMAKEKQSNQNKVL